MLELDKLRTEARKRAEDYIPHPDYPDLITAAKALGLDGAMKDRTAKRPRYLFVPDYEQVRNAANRTVWFGPRWVKATRATNRNAGVSMASFSANRPRGNSRTWPITSMFYCLVHKKEATND